MEGGAILADTSWEWGTLWIGPQFTSGQILQVKHTENRHFCSQQHLSFLHIQASGYYDETELD